MPNRGKFGSYEEDYLKETSRAILDVKGRLPLNEYLESQSVVNSSVNQINGVNSVPSGYANMNNGVNTGMNNNYGGSGVNYAGDVYGSSPNPNPGYGGNAETRQKTLVRKMDGPGYTPGVNNVSYGQNDASRQYMGGSNMGYYGNDGGSTNNPWLNKAGSTQTLILIFTAILVVLVIIVSLVVLKYMGM